MTAHPKPAPRPCPSCPYRRDVPSGLWDRSEYDRLPSYDGEIAVQALTKEAFSLFQCHQKTGDLCAGWLACHGSDNLLAVRLHTIDPSGYGYTTDVPLWGSGEEARAHGLLDYDSPGATARRMIDRLERKRAARQGG